ncbi:hypothetical protein HMPREF1991_01221 [Hoylesella loescheii DSM 19665 = JCM 12249 = ATCC 15930]|uniref:Uncharacterized protein n=1 Tax=Hoylesella loescheii DSM 19665 = JCM 12249 = ATCC 15930 TaxID=1122985 RepID=A0A069QKX0_HOYLO|nr:hypothetical protein HMPREF1991_01221 [Hoylesella loescheii DSM 19665 = JCM 12249 = ATCC 15930]
MVGYTSKLTYLQVNIFIRWQIGKLACFLSIYIPACLYRYLFVFQIFTL